MAILRFWRRRRKYGTGWIRNPSDNKDWDFDKHAGTAEGSSSAVSLRDHVPFVLNQKNTGSCTAHAVIGAAMIDEDRHGRVSAPLSTLYAYYNSRRQHYKTRIMRDSGTFIRSCVRGIQKLGCCDDKYWSFSTNPLKVNRQPNFKARMMAHSRRDIRYYAINGKGNKRIESVKKALDLGCPVVFGTGLASSFWDCRAPYIIDRPAAGVKITGRHAMVIIGYRQEAECLQFEILNSWGMGWGDKGLCWMTDNYIQWGQTRDLTVLTRWNENVG